MRGIRARCYKRGACGSYEPDHLVKLFETRVHDVPPRAEFRIRENVVVKIIELLSDYSGVAATS
jgi:hypothetical protein